MKMSPLNVFRMKFSVLVSIIIILISVILMLKTDDTQSEAYNTYTYIMIFGIIVLVLSGLAIVMKK